MDTRNAKWEFTVAVTGAPRTQTSNGMINPMKVVMTQTEAKCKVTVTGPSGPGAHRSQVYNISGYEQHPPPPQWVLDLIAEVGFARQEPQGSGYLVRFDVETSGLPITDDLMMEHLKTYMFSEEGSHELSRIKNDPDHELGRSGDYLIFQFRNVKVEKV